MLLLGLWWPGIARIAISVWGQAPWLLSAASGSAAWEMMVRCISYMKHPGETVYIIGAFSIASFCGQQSPGYLVHNQLTNTRIYCSVQIYQERSCAAPAQHPQAPQKLAQRTVANAGLSACVHENLPQGKPRLPSMMEAGAWQGRGAGEMGSRRDRKQRTLCGICPYTHLYNFRKKSDDPSLLDTQLVASEQSGF